jgi:crotonobetainyl-CoA:carnitine CoA-transferase CaiB-like acyl-CoA transferase
MSGIFLVGSVQRWLGRKSREKRLRASQAWPVVAGEVNHWAVVEADEDAAATGAMYQVEAGFHFVVNGEYFGGYLRSVAMTHHEAEMKAKGNPAVRVRYDPADPDSVVVLAEDNAESLPFRVISG